MRAESGGMAEAEVEDGLGLERICVIGVLGLAGRISEGRGGRW